MAGIELTSQLSSQSLYFAATQSASQQASAQAQKAEKTKKTSFFSALKRTQEETEIISDGLPIEIAGMSEEEAIVFLKDAMDIAADALKSNQIAQNMEIYKEKVKQFITFLTKNNYEIIEKRRGGKNRRGMKLQPFYQIQVINQKLNQLASDMMYNHRRTLNLLARVDEINGLVIDLLAG